MPAPRTCSVNGCVDVAAVAGRCRAHHLDRRRRQDRRRPSATARGYDTTWAKARAAYLALHPDCETTGCPRAATDVDHIDGLGPRGPRGFDHDNLRALCHSHHSQRTARDQRGGWNQ